jgi:hypothetical protein
LGETNEDGRIQNHEVSFEQRARVVMASIFDWMLDQEKGYIS